MVHDQKKLKEMLAIVPFSAELNSGLPNTWMHHPCAREITIKMIYQNFITLSIITKLSKSLSEFSFKKHIL